MPSIDVHNLVDVSDPNQLRNLSDVFSILANFTYMTARALELQGHDDDAARSFCDSAMASFNRLPDWIKRQFSPTDVPHEQDLLHADGDEREPRPA